MAWSSITYFFILIAAVIIGDIFSGDVTNVRQSSNNAWPLLDNNNKNAPLSGQQGNVNSKSTTPWPSLGQRRQPQQNIQFIQSERLDNRGVSFPRNTPFENQTPSNKSPNMNRENSQSGSVVSSRPVGGWNSNMGGGNRNQNFNSNNGMRGQFSTGSNYNARPSNWNQGPSNQREDSDVDDSELREFSEQLLSKDTNNAARYITINYQGRTNSSYKGDLAPLPLISIDPMVYSIPSIQKLMALYDNYILEVRQNEVYTAQEKQEENSLLDTIVPTAVMQHTRNFLIRKGKIGLDPKEFRDLLRLIWFSMYSRGGGRIGSSGFEHIFLAELKNNEVSGLHNWLYFSEEEARNRANYLGYMKKIDLGNKGALIKCHFTFQGIDKPVASMFLGTSPELEMALYTACFMFRRDRTCALRMAGNNFSIKTFKFTYRGKTTIGSAFPQV